MSITIYGINNCPWCTKAKKLAEQYGLEYEYIICNTPEKKKMFKEQFPDVTSVPQIMWSGRHIGGYTDFEKEIENTREYGQGGI
jgi:glutaredoxin|tara:strand:+ start:182 stop:433 length:252 start_codon:yes stop_codon:yes gene_type:complete